MFKFGKQTYYRDSYNNLIKGEKDILLTSEDLLTRAREEEGRYKKPSELKKLEGAQQSETGIYSCYIDEDGEIYDVICSAYTKEVIPFEALCYPTLYILLAGLPDDGKTTNAIQYIVDLPSILFRSEFEGYDTILQDYQYPDEFQRNFLRYVDDDAKPKPTNSGEISQAIPVRCEYKGKKSIVQFNETPGEVKFHAKNEGWWSSDAVFLFMDASLENEREVIRRIENMIGCSMLDRHIPVYVILTKADHAPELTEQIPNSLIIRNRRAYLGTHANGFDLEAQRKADAIIRKYLKDNAPRVLHKLQRFDCRFFLVGNYMTDLDDTKIPDEETRYRIETPLLCFLAENGLFPVKQNEKSPIMELKETDFDEETKVYDVAKRKVDLDRLKTGFFNWLKEDF